MQVTIFRFSPVLVLPFIAIFLSVFSLAGCDCENEESNEDDSDNNPSDDDDDNNDSADDDDDDDNDNDDDDDNDDDNDDDPMIYPGYPNCVEIISGHNSLDEPRVNWVFLGYQFFDTEKARQIIFDAVNYNGGSYWGLMNVEPFASNRDNINLWYVNKQGDYDDMESIIQVSTPIIHQDSLLFECPKFENEYVVIFQNTWDVFHMAKTVLHSCSFGDCTVTAGRAFMGRGYIWMFSAYPFVPFDKQEEAVRHYLSHEWGHIFGHLPDHYISDNYGDRVTYSSTQPQNACSDWCGSDYFTYDEVKLIDCAQYANKDDCDQKKLEYLPCFWHENQCVNVVDICSGHTIESECLAIPFCGFIHTLQPSDWHKSNCVPFNSGLSISDAVSEDRFDIYVDKSYPVIDVGVNCDQGTGCFNCGYRDIGNFRPDAETIMRQDYSNAYGVYQNGLIEQIIDDILNDEYNGGFWEYHDQFIE